MANPQGPIGPTRGRPLGSVLSPNTPRVPGPQGPSTPDRLESPQAPLGPTLPGYSAPTEGQSELNARGGTLPGVDWIERLGAAFARLLGPPADVIPSAAPGGGPSAEREGPTPRGAGGRAPRIPVAGGTLGAFTGYGGHGDPVGTVDAEEHMRDQIQELVDRTRPTRLRDPLRSRFRWQIPYSPEGHNQDGYRFVAGPWSMVDGTTAAVIASGVNATALSLGTGVAGPFTFLDRYPGALYYLVFVRSFAISPTAGTMTGLMECYYLDPGGAVAALGIYNAATLGNGLNSVGVLCATPLTDPGNAGVGTLIINGIGIGGTAVTARYQLGLGFVAMVPDPWFQAQQLVPPTPADITAALRAAEHRDDLTHANGGRPSR